MTHTRRAPVVSLLEHHETCRPALAPGDAIGAQRGHGARRRLTPGDARPQLAAMISAVPAAGRTPAAGGGTSAT